MKRSIDRSSSWRGPREVVRKLAACGFVVFAGVAAPAPPATAGARPIGSTPARAGITRLVSPTGSDIGDCSVDTCQTIGYAIGQSSSGDAIDIAAGTYAEHVVVDRSLRLEGAGRHSTIIDGSGNGRVVTIGAPSASLTVAISRITIKEGRALRGGGISSVAGTGQTNQIKITNTSVVDNTAQGANGKTTRGGGIYNGARSTMKILRSSISGNSATGYSPSEWADGGRASGGGIFGEGPLTLISSTVSGNTAQGGNGGRYACHKGFCHGPGRGGIGSGGGISGPATVVNSTIARNVARGGSGGCSLGCLNGGDGLGGAIKAVGSVTLVNTTVARNHAVGGAGIVPGVGRGGGIHLINGSTSAVNSILASNTADEGPDCVGSVTSGGHNVLGDSTSCAGFTGPGDLVGFDPLLSPLQDNSGPTFTIALETGSPAIDAGNDAICAAPPVSGMDQRGFPRPEEPHCDIGAFEVQPT
jgi:hypothetical protein